jgi:hypothetical protein
MNDDSPPDPPPGWKRYKLKVNLKGSSVKSSAPPPPPEDRPPATGNTLRTVLIVLAAVVIVPIVGCMCLFGLFGSGLRF